MLTSAHEERGRNGLSLGAELASKVYVLVSKLVVRFSVFMMTESSEVWFAKAVGCCEMNIIGSVGPDTARWSDASEVHPNSSNLRFKSARRAMVLPLERLLNSSPFRK